MSNTTISYNGNDAIVDETGALKVDIGEAGNLSVQGAVSITGTPTVIANQGTAGAAAWKVDGSAVTQPISGSVSISGTPNVAISGTPSVNINGTPSVNATCSGTITANIGTISTLATESSLSSRLSESTFTTRTPTVGQKTMANSSPVCFASDQSTLTVSGSVNATCTGTITANIGTISTIATESSLASRLSESTFTTRTPVLGQSNMAGSRPVVIASNQSTIPVSISASSRQFYSASSTVFTPPATPTDMITIYGSASKTIRVNRITFSSTQTSAGINNIFIIKRSATNTAGTSTTPTVVPLDSSNAAGTAVMRQYSVNPSGLGSAVGTITAIRILTPTTTSATQSQYVFDYTSGNVVLRGTSEGLCVNFAGAALPTGLSIAVSIEWEEV